MPRAAASSAPRRHPDVQLRYRRARRDAALHRAANVTKTVAVGTVVAVGALGFYLGKVLPGHSHASGATTQGTTAGSPQVGSSSSGGSSGALNPPSAAPQATQAPAPVVSGGS